MGMTMTLNNMVSAMKAAYAQADRMIAEAIRDVPLPCKRGCAHCCEILTLIQFPEALVIADAIMKRHDWKFIGRNLRTQAKLLFDENLTHESYHKMRLVCPLLDPQTKECSFYEVRPSACRAHYVVSPPEDCAKVDGTGTFSVENTHEAEVFLWDEIAKLFHRPLAAPLQLMVLHSMPMVRWNSYHKRLLSGVKSPMEWLLTVGGGLYQMAIEAKGVRVSPEDIERMKGAS